ncbi:MAG: class I SAM-dependent methyltransferase [Oscillospiraceae bacterium]|nr:class I SAM-dependent methyltransferase [Oscillospiraceae bacterium]
MRTATGWKSYRVIDCTDGEKLESWGGHLLIRPDPQVIWKSERNTPLWDKAEAHYHRSEKGGGKWEIRKKLPERWDIDYELGTGERLCFNIRPTGFKHTGLFPEQAVNWERMAELIKERRAQGKTVNVLNLFAYTGGATLACAAAGASVTHVDASKGMVAWARENAALSGLSDRPVRWIVDDCEKFVAREIRRGRKYDAVIMDPPSYGRGPSGEVWTLENCIHDLVSLTAGVLSEDPLFFLLNSYTTGLSPSVTAYILSLAAADRFGSGADVTADEIGLPVEHGFVLPCGASAWVSRR